MSGIRKRERDGGVRGTGQIHCLLRRGQSGGSDRQ